VAIANLVPDLISAVHKNTRKNRLVAEAIPNAQWIRDITRSLSARARQQYVWLWSRLNDVHLDMGTADMLVCKWTSHQQYSASSAYRTFFIGQCGLSGAKEFFMCLLLLGHCWMGERLLHQDLQDSDACTFCAHPPPSPLLCLLQRSMV
jgi:hypothetical protein